MGGQESHDYDKLLEQALELARDGKTKSMIGIAEMLGVNYNTLVSGFRRKYKIANFDNLLNYTRPSSYKIDGRDGEKISVELEGNFGEVQTLDVSGQIRTVDDLLKASQVDRKFWEPFEPTVRKWDMVLKLKTKDGDADTVQVVPSFYVACKLRRIVPIAFEPIVQPVEIPITYKPAKAVKFKAGQVRRALIVNDPQVGFRRRLHTTELVPFHDRRVLDLALQVAEAEGIEHISFGGDCLDFSEWSNKFVPEPEFFWTTQPALVEWAWWLAQYRQACPTAEMVELEGNHDARLVNMIVSTMRQAYRLKPVDEMALPPSLSVPRLLALHTMGVRYVDGYPDNGYWLNRNVFISHGDVVRSAPGATAAEMVRRQAFTTVFGHIHRREFVSRRMKTSGEDLIYSAFCPGCTCHIDGRVPGSSSVQQWQQGIAVIEYTQEEETIIPLAIQNGRMMYHGRLWEARDRDAEIDGMIQTVLDGSL